jgi:hypothetical protein
MLVDLIIEIPTVPQINLKNSKTKSLMCVSDSLVFFLYNKPFIYKQYELRTEYRHNEDHDKRKCQIESRVHDLISSRRHYITGDLKDTEEDKDTHQAHHEFFQGRHCPALGHYQVKIDDDEIYKCV